MLQEKADKIKLVLLISGKRKSGKDFIASLLASKLSDIAGFNPMILHISEPLKRQYAMEHGLDLTRLLDSSSYKEKFRSDMITWGEERRNAEPSYFCQLVAEYALKTDSNFWIVADIRRPTDIQYFEKFFKVFKIRITANDDERFKRGWRFTPGVDDAPSECALDDYNAWDVCFDNNHHNAHDLDIEHLIKNISDSRIC